ncbi:MAG: hypothetical protein EP329_12230 [Deltaproteobacteria bacterium]|nr:MAG: hypothetical protein EP329_12230 [Deltaproteobacteria bacterium]
MRALLATWAVAALVGCVSNPTPHPGQPDGLTDTYTAPDTGRTNGGGEKGPDLDLDGVPDCEQYGGYWDQGDSVCVGGLPTGEVDADVIDGDAPDGDVGDDAVDDAEAGDAADALTETDGGVVQADE